MKMAKKSKLLILLIMIHHKFRHSNSKIQINPLHKSLLIQILILMRSLSNSQKIPQVKYNKRQLFNKTKIHNKLNNPRLILLNQFPLKNLRRPLIKMIRKSSNRVPTIYRTLAILSLNNSSIYNNKMCNHLLFIPQHH